MSKTPNVCPFLSTDEEIKREITPLRDGEVARMSQTLLDEQSHSVETLIDFEKDLRSRWSYGLELDPAGTEEDIARTLRQVAAAAMSTVTYTHLLHKIVPVLEQTDQISPALPHTYDFSVDKFVPRLRGPIARGVNGLFRQLMDTSDEVLDEISGNPDHSRHSLWLAFEGAHQLLKATSSFPDFPSDVRHSWRMVAADNSWRTLETLIHLGHSHTVSTGDFPTKQALMQKAVRSVDALAWAATIKSTALRKLYDNFTIAQDFEDYQGKSLHDVSEFMPNRKAILKVSPVNHRDYVFKRKSLADGPWPKAAYCPGVPVLRMQSKEDREIVERFFNYFEQRFYAKFSRIKGENDKGDNGRKDDEGYFDRVTVCLLLGVLYAGDTIYANWPTGLKSAIALRV